MSARIRGQEITARVAIDGQTQDGSFFKIEELTITPRQDLVEKDYLGELESDLDFQHHGFDVSFSVDNQDEKTLDLLTTIIDRETTQTKHPDVTLTVIYTYREPGASNRVEVFQEGFIKVADHGFPGRKEYVKTRYEAKFKRRSVLSA